MTTRAAAPDSDGEPRLYALVPAAGAGQRAGTELPKQYVDLAGTAVIARTLQALARVSRLHATLSVLAPDDDRFERHVSRIAPAHRWVARCGGATRARSVANGLDELARRGAQDDDWVLVHDAARCLIEPAWVDALIDACLGDPVGGLLALPVADTLKQEQGGRVAATVDRQGKWGAQTPQMFRLRLLREALAAGGDDFTDEAGAVERAGHAPLLVRGHVRNIKLTWPEDFALARALLAADGRQSRP